MHWINTTFTNRDGINWAHALTFEGDYNTLDQKYITFIEPVFRHFEENRITRQVYSGEINARNKL